RSGSLLKVTRQTKVLRSPSQEHSATSPRGAGEITVPEFRKTNVTTGNGSFRKEITEGQTAKWPSAFFDMRILIESIDAQLVGIDSRQRKLLDMTPDESLFWTPTLLNETLITLSVGGSILRSAANIEQVFLGITRRLWDDPFEWTLPEKLSSKPAVFEY